MHKFRNPELGRLARIAHRLKATMMYLDAQDLFSDAQALTGNVVSTNIIDFGQDRNIGIGEPLVVVVGIDVAAGGTTPTLQVTIQADDNSGFASPGTVATGPTWAAAVLTAGAQFVIPVPPDLLTERFMRLSYTVGGTSPTVTVTAFLQPASMVQNAVLYASGIPVIS